MSISCHDLLNCATKLSEIGDSEVDYRASASRAYYSAYHHALLFYRNNELGSASYKDTGLHEKLIKELANPMHNDESIRRKAKDLAQKLRYVKTMRVRADYKMEQNFTRSDAQVQIASVKRILKI